MFVQFPMAWFSDWYVLVGFPCEEVYAMDGTRWDVNVVFVIRSEDLVLLSFIELGAMLLNIECDNLCTHVWWWLCNFCVMSVRVDVLDIIVHAIG